MSTLRFSLRLIVISAITLLAAVTRVQAQEQTLLLRQPALSQQHIAFVYGGDIWLANRDGSYPRRLTSHPAWEFAPRFSPDGNWIAFSATYERNTDVYIVPVSGGTPKRLTWHPRNDIVNGWSPTGDKVLFASPREIENSRSNQLYEVSVEGGFPTKIMEAVALEGAWSPDGKRIAYRPYLAAFAGGSGWRLHRGGSTPPIWIIGADGQNVEKIPHPRANETNPMWMGDSVYFLSDRDNKAVNLFRYDTNDKSVRQLTSESVWDIKSADAFGDSVIYEVGGRLKVYNTQTQSSVEIVVSINPDAPQLLPSWKNAAASIQDIGISPTGKRALITARGDVFTVPIKDGSTRNLTASSGVREMNALWSPKGDKIAYISDEGSVHQLVVVDQSGREQVRRYALGDPVYYTLLDWSADGNKLVYQDNHLHLYVIDLSDGQHRLIDSNDMRSGFSTSISPDGKWLAYSRSMNNYFEQILLYEFATRETTALTESMSSASQPAFSRDGKYLYFVASTNAGPLQYGLDMTTQEKPLRSAIYVAVLAADGQSPLLPKSGDENSDEESADDKKSDDESESDEEQSVTVRIDLDTLKNRIVALPVAERFYTDLSVADGGTLFFLERQQPGITVEPPESQNKPVNQLKRFDFEKQETSVVKDEIASYILSHDGKQLLIQGAEGALFSAEVAEQVEPEALDVSGIKSLVNPREEWQQIFDDAWRMEKEFFYADNLHGIDWNAIRERYAALLPHVITREDLNLLLVDMIAELQVGHNRVRGGDIHQETPVRVGLLGANLRVENDRYRVAKVFTGEQWNPFLRAPLVQPGAGVNEGDYILAVNGIEVDGQTNIYSLFADTVDKQVTLTINNQPSLRNAREVVVEPVDSEVELRQWNWIEENRRYVEEKTGGRVGYVYLPDTADGGYTFFNRLFFAQITKEAMIIDERKNNGGQAANYVIDVLRRNYLASWKDRDSVVLDTPAGAMYGPKVMLIDQDAGSGGDFLPYAFRYSGLGKLIGTRTWGGLIGISANPDLVDGGTLVVPFFRFFTPDGQWAIENQGVAPDIEVELEPDGVNRGIDTQLDRAIAEVMDELETFEQIKQTESPPLPVELGR